jgi:hypothetical protein
MSFYEFVKDVFRWSQGSAHILVHCLYGQIYLGTLNKHRNRKNR